MCPGRGAAAQPSAARSAPNRARRRSAKVAPHASRPALRDTRPRPALIRAVALALDGLARPLFRHRDPGLPRQEEGLLEQNAADGVVLARGCFAPAPARGIRAPARARLRS